MKYVEAHAVKEKVMRYAYFERRCIAVVTEGLRNADVLGITPNQFAIEFEIKVSRSDLQKELAAIKYAQYIKSGKNFGVADNDPEQLTLNMELASLKNKAGGWSKINKHEEHIDPKAYFEKKQRYYSSFAYLPNRFYLVVPDNLVDLAVSGVDGTPYGVISADGCRGQHSAYYSKSEDKWFGREFDYSKLPKDRVWKTAPCYVVSESCYEEVSVKKKAMQIHAEKLNSDIFVYITSRTINENLTLMEEVRLLNEKIAERSRQ